MEGTSDERREMAERLREHNYDYYEKLVNMSDSDLADLIDRPTCRNVSGYQDVFECSECRCRVDLIAEVCNEYGEPFSVSFMPSFCPNCGARVMD